MAEAKYQRQARSKGFAPINVQNQAPQRILEEAGRVAGGMRNYANAAIADRNRISDAMAQNYKIEASAREQNYKIEMGNLQAAGASAVSAAQARGAEMQQLFQGISAFSAGAARTATAYIDAKNEAQFQTDYNEFMTNPEYRNSLLAQHDASIYQGSAALTQANASAVATEMLGARPVETGRVLDSFAGYSPGQKAAIFDHKVSQFPSYLQSEMSGDRVFTDPVTGQTFSGAEAQSNGRLYSLASGEIAGSFMRENGFTQLSSQFTAKGMEKIRKDILKGQAAAEKNEIEIQKGKTLLRSRQTLLQGTDPVAVAADLLANKSALLRANDYDMVKTTKGVLEMVYARDARGEYIMNARVREAVLNSPWGPNGETLGSYRQLNAEFQTASRKARIAAHADDHKVAKLEGDQFWESQREEFEEILGEGDGMIDVQSFNTFEKQFYNRFPELGENDLPDSYKRLKKEILNENKIEEAQLVDMAEIGMVDLTIDQARSIIDPTLRETAIELVQMNMTKEYGGNYEDLQKSLKGYAKQLTGSDLSASGVSPMGQAILPVINADFDKYYKEELGLMSSGGQIELTTADYAAAQQKAIQRLQQDVSDGLLGKGKYARKKDTKNNLYEFPGLNLQRSAEQIRRSNEGAIKSYRAIGDKAFDAPSLILETDDLQRITDTFNKTGMLDVPPVVMELSKFSGELPVDIINRQIKARGDDRFDIIKPPSAYYEMKGMNPDVVKLFHEARTPTQRYRAMSQFPSQMANKGGTDDFEYFANSIAGVESASHGGYDAYNTGGSNSGFTAYGSGDSSKDMRFGKPISQLTVGEIRRLQANGQLHAAGRYQFIGSTFKEVKDSLGLPDSTVFSPEVQDQFMIERLRQRASFGQPLEEALWLEWRGLKRIKDDNPAEYQQIVNTARRLLNPNQSTTRQRVYTTDNIGPTSTGPHLDVKQVGGGRFDLTELDDYIEVDDKDHGTVSLSSLRSLTGNVGDSFDEHVARGSHGIDVGTYAGTEVYIKNGAKHVSNYETEHGTLTTIQLPDGRQFTFLHGKG